MSQVIVLDTHIWIWFITQEFERFPAHLSPVHKDPFDRLIIATALVYQAKLASIDGLFSQYSELNIYLMN